MTLLVLRDDALSTTADGFALRLSLPWIRSLPVASLQNPTVEIDGIPTAELSVELGDRAVAIDGLADERGWWFVQDRIVLRGRTPLAAGAHLVSVAFHLVVPYLAAGPDGPLSLPFAASRTLLADAPPIVATVSRDVA